LLKNNFKKFFNSENNYNNNNFNLINNLNDPDNEFNLDKEIKIISKENETISIDESKLKREKIL
jgi:hypothetical protein